MNNLLDSRDQIESEMESPANYETSDDGGAQPFKSKLRDASEPRQTQRSEDGEADLLKMLIKQKREYEDWIYFKRYKDQQEKIRIQDLVANLAQ